MKRLIFSLYDPTAPMEVHASQEGIAGILQRHDKQLRPVAESRYHSYELETLIVVETLVKFRIYLLGINFKVVTDGNALRTAQIKRDLTPRIARWWLKLLEHTFTI